MLGLFEKKKVETNPVLAAAATAICPDKLDSTEVRQELEKIASEIEQIQTSLKDLLSLEKEYAENEANLKLTALNKRKAFLENTLNLPYPRLSLEPLTWRNKKGWPKLCLFPVFGKPQVEILADVDRFGFNAHVYLNVFYPSEINCCYDDICAKLKKMAERYHSNVKLTGKWAGGLIPKPIKEKINDLHKNNFRDVYILAEPNWDLSEVKVFDPDPLLVAFYNKELFLIDQFDLTTLEKYVISEFSEK